MTVARTFMVALVGISLTGCGLFGASSAPPRSEARRLHITLVGGSQLNPGPSGQPNPIQACIYVVRSAGWAPLGDAGDTKCAGVRDDAVAASSRQVIAPNQVLQLSLDPATQDELWLLVDADYARRPPNYAPLRMHVDGGGLIHYAIWLDGDGIHDALRPGPVPIGAIAAAAGVAAVAVGVAVSGSASTTATPGQSLIPSRALAPSRFGRRHSGMPAASKQATQPQDPPSAPPPAAADIAPASGPPVTHVMPGTIFKPVAQAAPITSSDMTTRSDKTTATGTTSPPGSDFVIEKAGVRRIEGKSRHRLRYDLQQGGVQ